MNSEVTTLAQELKSLTEALSLKQDALFSEL
jgi:hypothetical protein